MPILYIEPFPERPQFHSTDIRCFSEKIVSQLFFKSKILPFATSVHKLFQEKLYCKTILKKFMMTRECLILQGFAPH